MFEHPRFNALSAFHDGELSPVAAAELTDHLRTCESCAAEYRALSSAANAVRHLRAVGPPANFQAMVRERVDAEERGMVPVLRAQILGGKRQPGFLSALGFGTLATVVLIGFVLLADYRYGDQAIPMEQRLEVMFKPLLSRSLNVSREREAEQVQLPADVVRVFLYAKMPAEFAVQNQKLGKQEGQVLYCIDLPLREK